MKDIGVDEIPKENLFPCRLCKSSINFSALVITIILLRCQSRSIVFLRDQPSTSPTLAEFTAGIDRFIRTSGRNQSCLVPQPSKLKCHMTRSAQASTFLTFNFFRFTRTTYNTWTRILQLQELLHACHPPTGTLYDGSTIFSMNKFPLSPLEILQTTVCMNACKTAFMFEWRRQIPHTQHSYLSLVPLTWYILMHITVAASIRTINGPHIPNFSGDHKSSSSKSQNLLYELVLDYTLMCFTCSKFR